MAATALGSTALTHNVALDLSAGTTADIVNNNSVPNNGRTILVVNTGATPGTVKLAIVDTPDGQAVPDVNVLDNLGGALAATKTYVVPLGSIKYYGNAVTVKCTQATTKLAAYTY
jgi:hypothetical protein